MTLDALYRCLVLVLQWMARLRVSSARRLPRDLARGHAGIERTAGLLSDLPAAGAITTPATAPG